MIRRIILIATLSTSTIAHVVADGYRSTDSPSSTQTPVSGIAPTGVVQGNAVRLREGTRVVDVSGRLIMIGRRWAFLPDRRESPDNLAAESSQGLDQQRQKEFTSSTRSETSTVDGRRISTSTTYSSSIGSSQTLSQTASSGHSHRPTTIRDLPQLLLAENLMLERIVQALRLDPADDRWTISGEITEYLNDNGLILKTAVRSIGVDREPPAAR